MSMTGEGNVGAMGSPGTTVNLVLRDYCDARPARGRWPGRSLPNYLDHGVRQDRGVEPREQAQ